MAKKSPKPDPAQLISQFLNLPEPTRKQTQTQALPDLIAALLLKYKIGTSSPEQTIRDHWTEIVGAACAAHSHPANITPRNSLLVLVSHPVIRNELFHHRAEILSRLQKLPSCAALKSLTLRSA